MTSLGANAPGGITPAGGKEATSRLSRPAAARVLTSEERQVWDLIPRGRANAVKQKRLAAQLFISTRTLQHVLKDLTEIHGLPIASACSPPMGVFIPETEAEIDAFVAQLRSRALSCFKRMSALNRAAASALIREQQIEIGFPEPPLRVAEAVCGQCHEPFKPSRSTQMYCGSECRYAAARQRGSI